MSMASEVVLEYPNGRTFTTTIDLNVERGMVFELFGRRWYALGPAADWQSGKRAKNEQPRRILCRSLERVVPVELPEPSTRRPR